MWALDPWATSAIALSATQQSLERRLEDIHLAHKPRCRAHGGSETRTMKAYRYLTGKDDVVFCHRVTHALNNGWQLYGQPNLTFDQKRGEVICGQVITKEVEGKTYDPEIDLSKL